MAILDLAIIQHLFFWQVPRRIGLRAGLWTKSIQRTVRYRVAGLQPIVEQMHGPFFGSDLEERLFAAVKAHDRIFR